MIPLPRCARALLPIVLAVLAALAGAARAASFTTSDGVRLHYTIAGPPHPARTLVFVPGLAMPGWIWAGTMAAFRAHDRVVAFDPRGQGASQIARSGYTAARRGQDLAELLARLGPRRVVLVAWSLGVLDTLAYIHAQGDARLAGVVLVDNSVGENPPPVWHPFRGPEPPYRKAMTAFVHGLFHTAQPRAWLDRLSAAALRLPPADTAALRRYDEPRIFWRRTAEAIHPPLLYIVRPWLAAQAQALRAARPGTWTLVFPHAGHALFIDDPARFDAALHRFLRHAVAAYVAGQ